MNFNFNITNQCNRQCPFCFEGRWRETGVQEMSIDHIRMILAREERFARKFRKIGVLGGEPTVHPYFKEIVGLIAQYVERVYVMTNGIMSEDTARFLSPHLHLLNVDGPRSPEQNQMFLNTIRIWDRPGLGPYGVSVTIDDPDKDFSFLIDLLQNTRNIKFVRAGISSPGFQFRNELLLKQENNHQFGNAYLRLVRNIREIRPDVGFLNECCLNDYVISSEDYRELLSYRIDGLKKTCPQPNLDIYPDMSVTWCFPFVRIPELTLENVLSYPNLKAAKAALRAKFKALCEKLGYDPRRDTSGCIAQKFYLANSAR